MKTKTQLHLLDHPIAAQLLTDIRDKRTDRASIRQRVRVLAQMLFLEASRDLPQRRIRVVTPLAAARGTRLNAELGLVPILRAGLGMVDGILELWPDARVFHLGLYRDEQTLRAVEYYNKLARHRPVDIAFILDPMLATGGSACVAAQRLKTWGVKKIKYLGLFAAPEGVAKLAAEHPDIPIHLGALDKRLNNRGYIVPGIGDAGDRQFSV
jgi:uracil phosphoribosyltransferase